MIGNNLESGAFIYGCMSLCDKLSSGVAIMAIQNGIPHSSSYQDQQQGAYFKDVLALGCCVLSSAVPSLLCSGGFSSARGSARRDSVNGTSGGSWKRFRFVMHGGSACH